MIKKTKGIKIVKKKLVLPILTPMYQKIKIHEVTNRKYKKQNHLLWFDTIFGWSRPYTKKTKKKQTTTIVSKMQMFTDLVSRFPFLPTLSRELLGPAFGYSREQAMIKSILVEIEREHNEGDHIEKADCVGVLNELASILGLRLADSSAFASMCRSVEQELQLL